MKIVIAIWTGMIFNEFPQFCSQPESTLWLMEKSLNDLQVEFYWDISRNRGPCNGYFISRRSFSWGWLTEWWLMKTLEHNILEKYPNLNFNDIHKRWIYFRYLLTQGCLPQTREHQSNTCRCLIWWYI
jgi:hypothetical protein